MAGLKGLNDLVFSSPSVKTLRNGVSLPPRSAREAGNWPRAALVVLFGAGLASCMVGPDYQRPALQLPALWSVQPAAAKVRPAELAQWWRRLNDPLLDQLIEQAVAGNLDVASAKAKIREARAYYRETAGALWPSANGSGSATHSQTAGSTSSADFEAGFDASWELDLFGGNRRSVQAARYAAQASEDDLRSTLLTMIGDIASYYVEARSYQAQLALAQRTAVSQRKTAQLTKTKFDAGASSAVDLARANGQAASTEADIPTLRASLAAAIHRIAILTGQQPSALDAELKPFAPIPRPRSPVPLGVPADVLNSRPDVRSAERAYAEYTAKVGVAEANRYPSASLTGSISTSANSLSDLGRSSTIGWSYGPSITVPIFQGGQLKAAVDVAKAQRDQYLFAYQSAVLTALEDVENAVVSLTQERIRATKLAASVAGYQQAASLTQSLYDSGSSSFLDVLDAERSLYSVQTSLIESRAAIATDYISLNKALGGSWDGVVDVSQPAAIDTGTGPHLLVAE